jgi:hypothetical protein
MQSLYDQIRILDKEKDYLLSINAKQFVDSLSSKSIFYELISYDLRNQDNRGLFNNITLMGVYNFILNLIAYNLYEGLMFKHYTTFDKQDVVLVLEDLWLKIYPLNYLNEETKIPKDYNYYFSTAYENSIKIRDRIDRSLIEVFGNVEHGISIKDTQMNGDFLPKMLILYQDFADNIPI